MPGRARKPTALKLIVGNRDKRWRSRNEPNPPRGKPAAPRHLRKRAREAWSYLSGVLDEMGVLTLADKLALENLCEAVADLRNARDALAARRDLVYKSTTMTGVMHRPYPEVAMVADADRRVAMWLSRFGLTPSDRAKVTAADKIEEDPAEAFLRARPR